MDFKLALNRLIAKLEEKQIQYGLIGGVAIGIYGIDRATIDIDFLVKFQDKEDVRKVMVELGYELIYYSENFSLFQSSLKPLGQIDFMHPKNETINEMIQRSEKHLIFNSELSVFVLAADDIIGLKLQAIKHNPKRLETDENDIIQLLKLQAKEIDLNRIMRFAEKLALKEYLQELIIKSKINE